MPEQNSPSQSSDGDSAQFPRQAWHALQRLSKPWRWVLAIIIALLVIRLVLPYVITWKINQSIAKPGSYQGRIEGVSLSLWRGAYIVHGLTLTVKRDDGVPKPLLNIDRIDIALDWYHLFKGRIRGSLSLIHPVLVVAPSGPHSDVKLPSPDDSQQTAAKPVVERWQDRVGSVVAFHIDTLRVERGSIQYLDEARGIDLKIGEFTGLARDIAGGEGNHSPPATFELRGITTGKGRLRLEGRAEPWAMSPTFEARVELEHVHLVDLNSSAKRLNGLSFRSGVFSAYAEVKAADHRLDGYIKPLFKDLDVATYGTDADGAALKLFWKAVIVVAENVLPNSNTEALAARIPISGDLNDPDTDTWTIIGSVLRNAFLSAILPGFDGTRSPA